jgi:hypothetical protein
MTESQWLASDEPTQMFNYLGDEPRDRKWRLFACACCRCVWGWISDPDERTAVEVAERFEDGQATLEERIATMRLVYFSGSSGPAAYASHSDLDDPRYMFSANVIGACASAQGLARWHGASPDQEKTAQATLLRDIVGNPFRPVSFNPAWRTDTAISLAKHMYDSRDFGAMPILADALQDAGCDSEDILNHCRQVNGVHVRGCWVVDLVLGKE